MFTQQGALLELQAWLRAAESQLEERCSRINQTSCTNADLTLFLQYCKVEDLPLTRAALKNSL